MEIAATKFPSTRCSIDLRSKKDFHDQVFGKTNRIRVGPAESSADGARKAFAVNVPVVDPGPKAPSAAARPREIAHHGIVIRDDYAWLKAPNWREVLKDASALPSDIRAHLDAENAYADALLAPLASLVEELKQELRERIEDEDATAPVPDGPFLYYRRWRGGAQHPCLVRRPRGGGEEELLVDGEALAAGLSFFQLGPASHSSDHRLLAYAVDEAGSEFFTIRLRDLSTGRDLADRVPNARADAVLNMHAESRGLRGRRQLLPLREARRQPPRPLDLASPHRDVDGSGPARLRGKRAGLVRVGAPRAHGASRFHRGARPRDLGSLHRRSRTVRRAAASRRAPRGRRALRDRDRRNPGFHPNQPRRRGGFQDRRGAARGSGAGKLAQTSWRIGRA